MGFEMLGVSLCSILYTSYVRAQSCTRHRRVFYSVSSTSGHKVQPSITQRYIYVYSHGYTSNNYITFYRRVDRKPTFPFSNRCPASRVCDDIILCRREICRGGEDLVWLEIVFGW